MILIILACIAALISLILLMRVRLLLTFKDGKINAHAKVLCFKIELYSDKKTKIKKSDYKIKKFRRRRDKVLKQYRIKKAPKKTVGSETKKKHKSPITLIKSLKDMFSDTIKLVGKHHKIDRFRIEVTVGGGDAAKTALNYGYVISALQFLVTYLEGITNLSETKDKSASVKADFNEGKWDARLDISVSARVLHLIKIAISAFKGYSKNKNKSTKKISETKGT